MYFKLAELFSVGDTPVPPPELDDPLPRWLGRRGGKNDAPEHSVTAHKAQWTAAKEPPPGTPGWVMEALQGLGSPESW